MGFNIKKALGMTVVAVASIVAAGCSSSSSDGGGTSSSSAIGVTGTLSLSNTAQGYDKVRMASINGDSNVGALALSDYSVTCATTTVPIVSASGPVGSDGSFSVSIPGAAGQPMSCFLVDANGQNKGDFLIQASSTDMNGNPEVSTTVTPTADLVMGAVTFDPDAGEVTVPASAIAASVSSAAVASVLDPTGAWTIASVDFPLPDGVRSTCSQAENQSHSCNGPPDGQTIYLKRWAGVKTADSSNIYGLQVWDSEAGFNSCGAKIGLPVAVKSQIGVDFSANGSADAEFDFASSLTGFSDNLGGASSVTLTENWKMSTATMQHSMAAGCEAHDVSIGGVSYTNAWVCGPDSNSRYQININGGCTKDSDGSNVQVNNWSGINSCTSTVDANGVRTSSCSGTANSVAVTCTNKWAVATMSSGNYVVDSNQSHNFNYSDLPQINNGDSCSAVANSSSSNALKVAQLQCYAEYYQRSGLSESSDHCVPRIEADWSSSDPAHFIDKDFRPNKLIFFEQFKPFPDGSGGAILTRQEHYNGVQVGSNNWVNCRVIEMGGLSIKKISDTKMLATYVSSEITTSTAKPACVAAFTGSKKTFVFYLNK